MAPKETCEIWRLGLVGKNQHTTEVVGIADRGFVSLVSLTRSVNRIKQEVVSAAGVGLSVRHAFAILVH